MKVVFTREPLEKRSSGHRGAENCWIRPPTLLLSKVLPQGFLINVSLKTFNEPGLWQVQIFFIQLFFFFNQTFLSDHKACDCLLVVRFVPLSSLFTPVFQQTKCLFSNCAESERAFQQPAP